MLASSLVRFIDSLTKCSKLGVRFLAGISEWYLRTVMGQNISSVATEVDDEAVEMVNHKNCYTKTNYII